MGIRIEAKKMADKDESKPQQTEKDPEEQKGEAKSLVGRLLPFVIILIVVVLCSCLGLGLGRLFAGSGTSTTTESDSSVDVSTQAAGGDLTDDSEGLWYYELEPVVANLNEPSVTRYVSATLTFEMSSDLEEREGRAFLDEKKPIIINWLTIYLSGLGLDDIRGDRNLMTIKSQVRESLNEILFPDSKPQIKEVLIQKFPVQ